MATSLVNRAGFGVSLDGTEVTDGSAALGLTPQKVTLPPVTNSGGIVALVRCRIVNPNASAVLAIRVVPRDAAAPTFDATFAATGGRHVRPNSEDEIIIPSTCDLYIVASAITSSWAVYSSHVH